MKIIYPTLVKGRCEKIGLVLFNVIPAKAGIQCLPWVTNNLVPGFHLPARSRFGEGRPGRRVRCFFSQL
jgi:hypothetical protein